MRLFHLSSCCSRYSAAGGRKGNPKLRDGLLYIIVALLLLYNNFTPCVVEWIPESYETDSYDRLKSLNIQLCHVEVRCPGPYLPFSWISERNIARYNYMKMFEFTFCIVKFKNCVLFAYEGEQRRVYVRLPCILYSLLHHSLSIYSASVLQSEVYLVRYMCERAFLGLFTACFFMWTLNCHQQPMRQSQWHFNDPPRHMIVFPLLWMIK